MKKHAIQRFLLKLFFPKETKEIIRLSAESKKLANSIRLKQAELDKFKRHIRQLEREIKKIK